METRREKGRRSAGTLMDAMREAYDRERAALEA